MANQLLLGRALDANGYIAPGAKATVYADGTSTLITVYSDVDGTTPATNPIVADGDGFWPQRYVTEDSKAVVTTSADVALYTQSASPRQSTCRKRTCRPQLKGLQRWLCLASQPLAWASPATLHFSATWIALARVLASIVSTERQRAHIQLALPLLIRA